MEEDIDVALNGILLGDLREAEGKVEEINPKTAKIGGKGDRQQKQV